LLQQIIYRWDGKLRIIINVEHPFSHLEQQFS
jgi:hypothetical protein